jgi:hypothetical protein
MRHFTAFIFLLALTSGALAQESAKEPAKETLKPGDIISGKLRHVDSRHPNGTLLHAYQIVSNAPKELAAEDDFCDGAPKTFHLVASTPAAAAPLKRLLGKTVSVKIEDVMCSQTAWHIGDAVVFKWQLVAPPR